MTFLHVLIKNYNIIVLELIFLLAVSVWSLTVWPERFHLWNLQKRLDRWDWPLNLVLCFRSSPSVKHSLCSWQLCLWLRFICHFTLSVSFFFYKTRMPLHKCFYISIFYFVTLTETKATTHRTWGQETPFHPARPPGVYIKDCKTRADIGKFLRHVNCFLPLAW